MPSHPIKKSSTSHIHPLLILQNLSPSIQNLIYHNTITLNLHNKILRLEKTRQNIYSIMYKQSQIKYSKSLSRNPKKWSIPKKIKEHLKKRQNVIYAMKILRNFIHIATGRMRQHVNYVSINPTSSFVITVIYLG